MDYKIVPLIFPKDNMDINKILSKFSYPLECFGRRKDEIDMYRRLVRKFKHLIFNWKDYKKIRSKIEDFFK